MAVVVFGVLIIKFLPEKSFFELGVFDNRGGGSVSVGVVGFGCESESM